MSAIVSQLNDLMKSSKTKILNEVKSLIPKWILDQPEVQSLLSRDPSSLAGQFGIEGNVNSIINTIISSVVNSTNIVIVPFDNKLKNGGMELNIQPEDLRNLLGLSQGHTIYTDGDLHWLNWLLTRGDEVIVIGYEYNPQTGFGRSKLGTMKSGTAFRVPPQFSGTDKNNFITRALTGNAQEKEIAKIFEKVLGG